MKYTPIQAERLYERIAQQIEQRLLTGDLKVGDWLPPERELAEQFGVSRTAVREAVKALRQKGLVEVQPGRGTFITDGTSRAMRHSLDLLREQRARIFRVDGGPQRGQFHHKRILEAIVRRDPEVARETMRAHLRQVREDSEASGRPRD